MTTITATQITIPNNAGLSPDETAYQLDSPDAEILAVRFVDARLTGQAIAPDMYGIMAVARQIDSAGLPMIGHDGHAITAQHITSCKKINLGTGVTTKIELQQDALDALINADDGIYAEILINKA